MPINEPVVWTEVGQAMARNLLPYVEKKHDEKVYDEFPRKRPFRSMDVRPVHHECDGTHAWVSMDELAVALSQIESEEMLAVVGLALTLTKEEGEKA